MGDKLVQASDLLAEQMASLVASRDYEALHQIAEAHHRLWQVRWELGLHAEGIKAAERDVDYVTEQVATKAAGGAS
ncbi:MAG TPA: hypothetical protein VMI54_15760 [Polyangiaceae bacterium]|nr:hypothetical protein [Polyangiaceae bacterium]